MSDKIITCLWFDQDQAGQAARFYMSLGLPDSHIDSVTASPADTPSGPAGQELVVNFTLAGRAFMGLNGGPAFPQTEAVSFVIQTEDQAETDRLWDAIVGNGGRESDCGWCKDRWGVSWQIIPTALSSALQGKDGYDSKYAFEAMMKMSKIVIADLSEANFPK